MKPAITQCNNAINELRGLLHRDDTIYVIVHSMNRMGDIRKMSFFITIDDEIRNITSLAAKACQWEFEDNRALIVGAGMDMGLQAVSEISATVLGNDEFLKHKWL